MQGICHRRAPGVLLARILLPLALWTSPSISQAAEPVALASGLQAHATGVFVNAGGDVLTANHAVADCTSVFVLKNGQVVRAEVLARDTALDLAVLKTALKPYLAAVFDAAADNGKNKQGAFAESYNALQTMPQRASTLFNAMILPDGEGLSLLSPVQPGASGSPVLGGEGRVLGIVVERVAVQGGPSGRVALVRAPGTRSSAATRVKAVPAARVKNFLRSHHVSYEESHAPQLGPMQAQAPRAATLSVGVICG